MIRNHAWAFVSPPHYIYGLYDPLDRRAHPTWKKFKRVYVRYVGAGFDIEHRRKDHVAASRKYNDTHKQKWIRWLLRQGREPSVLVLEICTLANWQERETAQIASFPSRQLTNSTKGGEGLVGARQEVHDRIGRKISIAIEGNQYRKGIGWITNGKENRCWLIGSPIPEGFRRGTTFRAKYISTAEILTRPRQITNGLETRMLPPEEPLPEGWFYGRKGKTKPQSPEHRLAISVANTGKKRPWAAKTAKLAQEVVRGSHWINNGVEECFLKNTPLPEGWSWGRIKIPRPPKPPKPKKPPREGPTPAQIGFYVRMKEIMADKRWITNGVERRRLNNSDPLPSGWVYMDGTTSKWINNGIDNALLLTGLPLPDGWRFGMIRHPKNHKDVIHANESEEESETPPEME